MKVYLSEVRKEDNKYFQGPFWIIANNFKDILKGNFRLINEKFLCDYDGNDLSHTSKSSKVHKKLWNKKYASEYLIDGQISDYDYYPRGRVSIYQGTAFIHINSKCNLPKIIDEVIKEYDLNGLEIEVEENDTYQGSHYDFQLK